MIPIITPKIMQEEEALWEIQDPIKRVEKAADSLFETLADFIDPNFKLLFLIGKGLNGADGLALCRLCVEAGIDCEAYLLYEKELFKEETLYFFNELSSFDVIKKGPIPLTGRYILIDAVFGAGFKGPLESHLIELFQKINQSKFFKIAIDVPSGVSGETGIGTEGISCDVTFSVGLPKWGLFVEDGRNLSGQIYHVDIGLKKKVSEQSALGYFLQNSSLFDLLPKEKPYLHKYERGQVVGFASAPNFMGASFLYSAAAYRAGAGLVRILHDNVKDFFTHLFPEVTQHTYQDLSYFLSKEQTAFCLGPGASLENNYKTCLDQVLHSKKPCVIDGGGLNHLNIDYLHKNSVITPHLRELQELTNSDTNSFDVLYQKAFQSVLKTETTLVIKGHHTWICTKDSLPIIASLAPPCSATAGSGDVLSGIIATFLSKGMQAEEAAILGVGLHSLSCKIAQENRSIKAIVSHDIIDAIPEALDRI
jgi:NAD(P)H-hydrate epimerase